MTMFDSEPLSDAENYRRVLRLLDRLEETDLADLIEEFPAVDEGPCDDCGRNFARARVAYGVFTLCRVCLRRRVNVLRPAA
jgi:hypothetical protein